MDISNILTTVPHNEILVVEDTPSSLCLLTDILVAAGYTVRQAEDGEMALATIRSRLPDLILLDISMPGMDGFEVCRRLKSRHETRSIPVIFCTAMHDTEFKVRGFEEGAVDYITKPYFPEEVLVRVNAHISLSELNMSLEQRVAERTTELEAITRSLQLEIDRRKAIEHELKLSSKAFESSYSGIFITDCNGFIVAVNPAFTRITGYSKDECSGNTPRILRSNKHNVQFFQKQWGELLRNGCWSGEIWNRVKNGNVIPMMETIQPIYDQDHVITHYIATISDLSESKDAQTLIDFLSFRDSLTGLPNRLVARKYFEHEIVDSLNEDEMSAIFCLDIDRFKIVNDSLGHNVGDQLLTMIASRLNDCCPGHNVSRDGGDEFMIITKALTSLDDIEKIASCIVTEVAREFSVEQYNLSISTSIGIALYPVHADNFSDLMKASENALYHAKKDGGNGFTLFSSDMDTDARLRMNVETCLRGAISNNEFELVYQPKLCLKTGAIVGSEALVRWNSPVLGFVSPANFIPLAEETGFIIELDEWVVNTVCQQIKTWYETGYGKQKVSVNLSVLQFHRGDLVSLIQRVLYNSMIDPGCLDLEITEGVLMENIHTAVPVLESLKELGVSVSLDDFGTGYSSLSYLKSLPIDTLKIDKVFVDEIHTQSNDAVIARSIISLGHNLGLNVIAEGVEYEEQLNFLREQGCDQIQGYYFSKPLSIGEFEQFIANNETNNSLLGIA